MPYLHSSSEQLTKAWKSLLMQWNNAKAAWDDIVQRTFEKNYWTPLEHSTKTTQQDMDQLAKVMAEAQRQIR